ncbi:MAG TPA: DegT/DnrJ/EryC1/StrS family aminotransferase [Terriglobia bacterium]|jgi:dTDP-4-amino-4,6-dideoxygalactose transaminase
MEFNDVRLQYESLHEEIDGAIREVLNGGRYILGPAAAAFEQAFARYCRAEDGIAVGSGTDALAIALRAFGVRPGDEVIVPAVSAAATAMAVTQIGGRPVFADISAEDFNIDPSSCFERKTTRTKAVVPVHLYGMPARLQELSHLGLPVLEDAAQAHGSNASWGRCGSFGLAAAFSFYPTKNLGTYGDGGMIVTSDAKVANECRLLRNYGQQENYSSEILGQNSRLDELHAAILRVKLRKLEDWNNRRRAVAAKYRAALAGLPLAMQAETGSSNCHLFVVTTASRDKLRAHLAELKIPTLVHYPIPLHRQKAFAEFNPAHCPNADLLCSRVLSLPMHAFLTEGEIERVIEGVRGFFG